MNKIKLLSLKNTFFALISALHSTQRCSATKPLFILMITIQICTVKAFRQNAYLLIVPRISSHFVAALIWQGPDESHKSADFFFIGIANALMISKKQYRAWTLSEKSVYASTFVCRTYSIHCVDEQFMLYMLNALWEFSMTKRIAKKCTQSPLK